MQQAEAYFIIEQHYRANFDNLVKKYNRFLHSIARAEDIVQEAYSRALKYWDASPSSKKLETYQTDFPSLFGTILNNCMKDNQRTEAQHGAVSESAVEDEQVTKPSAIPAIIYEEVVQLIGGKSEGTSKVLHLFFVKQLNAKEVAQVMDMSPNAVRQEAWRFRREIRDLFRWSI